MCVCECNGVSVNLCVCEYENVYVCWYVSVNM